MIMKRHLHLVVKLASALSLCISPCALRADYYSQNNLVANTSGVARVTDPNLIDPWGFAYSATSPFWTSNQGSATSTLYDGAGNPSALVVTIPGGGSDSAGPTGQVFAGGAGFTLSNASAANFIFDTLQGTIAGWNGAAGTTAITMVSTPGASYTGLALANSGGANYIYAADTTGQIRVFNTAFAPVTLAGSFTDPNAVAGFVPFNIQLVGSQLYVTYAQLDASGNDLAGGYVDVYNTNGTFVKRFSSGGSLFAPWGVTLAPSTFGTYSNDLLIGNNGDGVINAFNPLTGAFVGSLNDANGNPLANDDLWAIGFRTGGANDNTSALYFAAGNNGGGLFGDIVSAPEPTTVLLAGLGVLGVGLITRRKSRA
jgi:uncharacterized protein (TIGR03118 family)